MRKVCPRARSHHALSCNGGNDWPPATAVRGRDGRMVDKSNPFLTWIRPPLRVRVQIDWNLIRDVVKAAVDSCEALKAARCVEEYWIIDRRPSITAADK